MARDRHQRRYKKVDPFDALAFAGANVTRRIDMRNGVRGAPSQDRMTAVPQLTFGEDALQIASRGIHRAVALRDRNACQAIADQPIDQHRRVPPIVGKLANPVDTGELQDLQPDRFMIDGVALCGRAVQFSLRWLV